MRKSDFIDVFFDEELLIINDIRFTPREIDLLACLLKVRSTKKIASLLSIYPKTVRNHLHNIMVKLGCNSRDSIIEFMEKSEKLSLIKEHYSTLTLKASFEQSLKEISKIKRELGLPCKLIYWTETTLNDSFVRNIQAHLKLAGINASLDLRKNKPIFSELLNEPQKDFYIVYFLPKALTETFQTSALLNNKESYRNNDSSRCLFLLLEALPDAELFAKELSLPFLDLSMEENYFFAFFKLLNKLFPNLNVDNIVTEFKDKHNDKNEYTPQNFTRVVPKYEKVEKFIFHQRWIYFFSIWFLMAFIGTGYMVYPWTQKNQGTVTLHSDLIIPVESVFLNRPELTTQIDDAFNGNQGIQTVALIGAGGSGKTTLARHYAQQQKTNIVWEINAESQTSLFTSFEKLAYEISKDENDQKLLKNLLEARNISEKKEQLIGFVKERLALRSPWFLIFDNVENFADIQGYFPQNHGWGQGKIIITTRNDHIRNSSHINNIIAIETLNKNQKLTLFTRIMTHGVDQKLTATETEKAKKFLEHIPPLPLDISVTAYYLKSTNISYAEYLKKLEHSTEEMSQLQENILKENGQYTKTRYAIITQSLDHLIKEHKDFPDLLLFISFLDSQNIPKSLLDYYQDSNLVDNFIYQLKKHSLMTAQVLPSLSEPTYSMHRSTQGVSLAYLKEHLKVSRESPQLTKIVSTLDDYADQAIEQEDFVKMRILAPHLERMLRSGLLTEFSQGVLGSKLGSIYYFMNNDKTKNMLENSLKILVAKPPESNVKFARSLLNIGVVYTELRQDKEALEVLEKAVNIYKQEGPKNYAALGQALSYLGNIHRKLSNYEKARICLEKSIHLAQQYQDDGKRIARTLSYLGTVYRGLGSYQKSIDTLQESLDLYQKNDLNEHFRVGWIQVQLGNVNRDVGNFQKAKEQLENGLRIFQKHLPEYHVSIGLAFAYLGNCYRELGDYEKSRYYLEQSLDVHKKHFSDQHIKMGWLMFNLANTYKALGRLKEAEQLFDKVLKIYKAYEGEDNIEKARLLRSMAKIYLEKNFLTEAESVIEKSLWIFQSHNHVETYRALKTLGEILLKKSTNSKNKEDTKNLKNQALEKFKEALKITEQYFQKGSINIQKLENRIKEQQ